MPNSTENSFSREIKDMCSTVYRAADSPNKQIGQMTQWELRLALYKMIKDREKAND